MTLQVVPEGLASASAAVEAITARLAAAHAGAAPAITAVVPSATFAPAGKTSMNCLSEAPFVRVKWGR